LRVLIVDDSDDDATLVTEALREENVEIVSCRVDNATALRMALRSGTWDVVISDYSMTHFTSDEVLRIVKETDPTLPFIVVSGLVGEDAAVDMMRAGAADYVMKDRLTRLLPAIQRVLRDMKARQSRDETESSMRELRERLQATVERAPVGIVNVGRDGRFLHVNPRFCEMVGYECEELMTLRFSDITHPMDAGLDVDMMQQMTDGSLSEYRTEKRYRRKDGETVWVSLSSAPVCNEAGECIYFASIMVDITEKKTMEAALRERDERYRQIVDTAQEGIWTIDTDSRTTFVNGRMADMLGYTAEEMLGRHLHDFVYDADKKRADERADRRREGVPDDEDFILRRKNGESIRIHFVANPLRAADGTHIGALAMVTDITARWNAEEMVLRQKRELEEAQRIAHIGSWRRDLPGDAIEWSEELYRIFGLDDTISPTLDLLIDAVFTEDREKIMTSIARALEDGLPIDVAFRIVRPDETVRWVQTFGEITRDATGVATQMRGVTQDITDRIAAAAVHENVTRNLQLLLESTTQGIFGINRGGRCTFINRAASDSLGYAQGQLVGASMHEVVHGAHDVGGDSAEDCPIDSVARTGAATEVQSDMLKRRDGTLLPVDYSAAPIIDNGSVAGAVVVFTDVSERKLMQAQLEQSDRVSSLGRLAATMAHEFNNVLMGIQPFAELLSRQNPGESSQRATLNILQAVQRGRSVTHDILRFARPAELVKETIDVTEWLGSMNGALSAVLGDGVCLRTRIEGHALFVRGDRHQLDQVLTNLAANARDAMRGMGELSIVVERCLSGYVFPFGAIRTADQYLHISVTDTGCGMDAKTLKNVFDPFFTTKRAGTGLGLAVVHQVMQLHGGIIIPESVVGNGTVFHLFLPLAEEAFDEIRAKTLAVRRPAVGSVLLVEDDEAISSGVADLLRDEGVVVDVAATGAAALVSLASHLPDVVILDVGLPDVDGRRLYEGIAAAHPDLAIIFASGNSDEELVRPYLKSGQIESLSKPYEFGALLDLLGKLNRPAVTARPSAQLIEAQP
jgi:PAS domain S-box-containing protein